MPYKRDYKKERQQETPQRKKKRAARNRARRKLGLKVGDPRHVHHKDGNAMNNSRGNLTIRSAKANMKDQPKRK